MHQNRSISTLLTPFDHFQKRVFGGLISWHHLRPCPRQLEWTAPNVNRAESNTWT